MTRYATLRIRAARSYMWPMPICCLNPSNAIRFTASDGWSPSTIESYVTARSQQPPALTRLLVDMGAVAWPGGVLIPLGGGMGLGSAVIFSHDGLTLVVAFRINVLLWNVPLVITRLPVVQSSFGPLQ